MYAAPQKASVRGASLPKQMLLAFARTVLLQPGDHTTVCMPVDLADLRQILRMMVKTLDLRIDSIRAEFDVTQQLGRVLYGAVWVFRVLKDC